MVEGGRGPSFPVVFFDGEREIEIGDVKINPTLEYKPFQHMLSQKIGISPNQMSIYLVYRGRNQRPPFSEDRRRIPITGKVNFGLICRQKDCSFLVVLKRSRKSRSRRERTMSGVDFHGFFSDNEFSQPPQMHPVPENLVLLRRNQPAPFYDQITQSQLSDLNDRLHNLKIQRENYQIAMGRGNLDSPGFIAGRGHEINPMPNLSVNSIAGIGDWRPVTPPPFLPPVTMVNNGNRRVFCEECEKSGTNWNTTSFHPCVNDAVITGRIISRLGPINRLGKAAPSYPWR
ncbi:tRNA(Ile)-lysidine synthase [Striga asiatica]|uniref:tRNA(Ile)-lysidine synthase n=1 Tax=Striga asiatica TaxID=4170 RepID=A0A5A7P8R1_STRAF|nr:tRNA(Ile)-lysidine synthase [Striga asiatica]